MKSELLTACLTILGGIIIYASGQIISKFLIEPIHEQSRIIGEICDSLIYYADLYSNPGKDSMNERNKARNTIRRQATLLVAKTYIIKFYVIWEFFRFVPKKENITKASKNLIGISNGLFRQKAVSENSKRRHEIEKLLNIKVVL